MERRTTFAFRLFQYLLVLGLATLACVPAQAQTQPLKGPAWDGHLIWVLPFQNDSPSQGVEWIGTSFPDIMNQRLSSAGFLTIRREDRRYALTHLGLPADFHPTQATAYRIAQTLDADYVVFGHYRVANGRITATARVLVMSGPRLNAAFEEQGALDQLLQIEDELAWKIAMQIDPTLHLDKQTFLAASRDLRLDAFENYIRGEMDPNVDQQIGHLTKAVQLSPGYVQAWFALGRAYFRNQQYEEAEVPFSKIRKGNRLWMEAMFYAGLSHLYTGNYDKAQVEFAGIASVLPMPEVLNNEGVALNRKGQNGTVFFERVVHLDPQNADYWFNLAVSKRRTKDYAGALQAVERSITLRPQDQEALTLKKNLVLLKDSHGVVPATAAFEKKGAVIRPVEGRSAAGGGASTVAPAGSGSSAVENSTTSARATADSGANDSQDYEPLERIARSYDESSFRQAAFEMEQMNAIKLRSMPAAERAKVLCQHGTEYVNDGLLLEAERQFQLAIAADPASAAAYAGLAQVHERVGSAQLAQQEANKSLQLSPNVDAFLVLARIALAQRSYPVARTNVEQALKIDPNNTAAKGILQAIETQQSQRTIP